MSEGNNGGLVFDQQFIYAQLDVDSFADAINKMSQKLIKQNYVVSEFPEKVIAREKDFPTGLALSNMNISIPHTEASYVHKTVVSVATLKNKINVHSMIDQKQEIQSSMLFFISVNDPKGQITILKQLMKLFQKENLLDTILHLEDAGAIAQELNNAVEN